MLPKDSVIELVGPIIREESGRGVIEHAFRIYSALAKTGLHIGKIDAFSPRQLLSHKFGRLHAKDKDVIYHYLDPSAASVQFMFKSKPSIVTIHDLDFLDAHHRSNKFTSYSGGMSTFFTKPEEHLLFYLLRIPSIIGLRQALKNEDHFIFVSDLTMRDFVKRFKVDSDKCHVIPPIVGDRFRPLKKHRKSDVVIGHISSYSRSKNAGVLIRAFKKVHNKNYELHLGGGVMPYKINDDPRIKRLGFLPSAELPAVFNSFDVFVFPSTWEGFGMPVMEAKKCKVPVITYAKGNLPDIVKRNTLQFKDEKDLVRILETKKWRDADVDKAYEDVKICEEKNVVREIIKVYGQALSHK